MPRIPQHQLDLFVASATDVSTKEHREFMSRNWFSLESKKRTEPIYHEFGDNNWLKISADADIGIATMFDNDILLFIITQYMAALNSGKPPEQISRNFQFTGYEYFRFIGKQKFSGKGYADLWKSLERLHHTFVETNLHLGESRRHSSFTWLSEIKQVIEGGTHRGFQVSVPDWLYQSVVNKKMVLTLDDGYFDIRSSLERFLYLFARKSSGWQVGGWGENIQTLYKKSGSRASFPEFSRAIKKIVAKGSILGYKVSILEHKREKALYFLRDNELVELSSKNRQLRGANIWRKGNTDG